MSSVKCLLSRIDVSMYDSRYGVTPVTFASFDSSAALTPRGVKSNCDPHASHHFVECLQNHNVTITSRSNTYARRSAATRLDEVTSARESGVLPSRRKMRMPYRI
jgi:hypothetical protein